MSQKVCQECTTRYAHSLEKCPQCSQTDFEWDHVVDNPKLERPKDSDNIDAWKAYAVAVVTVAGAPGDAEQINTMTKKDLIELFGG